MIKLHIRNDQVLWKRGSIPTPSPKENPAKQQLYLKKKGLPPHKNKNKVVFP